MRRPSIVALAGLVGFTAALGYSSLACTITTTNAADDGGPASDDAGGDDGALADGGADGGGDGATSSPLGFAPSNVSLSGVDVTKLADVSLSASTAIDSDVDDSATLSSVAGGVVYTTSTQSDGSKIGVYVAKSWSFAGGAAVHVKGAYPIAFVALTTIDVAGKLDANAAQTTPAAGAPVATATAGAGRGAGPSGDAALGIAGSGGTYCGQGGAGGSYTGQTPPTPSAAYGTTALSPLVAGSTGGVGFGAPGAGGGAIQLVAGTSITIEASGVIAANGGGGHGSGSAAAGAIQTGAGGGSGGAILLESPGVSVLGTLAANGGGGGGNSANAGQDGQSSATPASGTGTGSGTGGSGSAGTTIAGSAGEAGSGATGTGNDIPPAGGGGGAGTIRINSKSGAATIDAAAVISPAATTTCVSQGAIAATGS